MKGFLGKNDGFTGGREVEFSNMAVTATGIMTSLV